MPLRLAAGFHALARSGAVSALSACYPPNPAPDAATLRAALAEAMGHPALPGWLDRPPRTNEIARSAVVMAGLSAIAAKTDQPLDLIEIGCAAGLNLLPDRYAIRLGDVWHGDPGSPVRLTPEWRGQPPPRAPVRIASRRGCDLDPLDVHDVADRETLLAYTWADQPGRLARAEAALAIAAARPSATEAADAADFCTRLLATPGVAGRTRVLFHTIAFQYFSDAAAIGVRSALAIAARDATAAAPFAHLGFEFAPDHLATPALRLTLWPGGATRLLARAGPHGQWIAWHGGR